MILGGDMVSGDIHDELRETNEVGPVEAAERFPALLVGHLKGLADKFGNVHVKGVAGNHDVLRANRRRSSILRAISIG